MEMFWDVKITGLQTPSTSRCVFSANSASAMTLRHGRILGSVEGSCYHQSSRKNTKDCIDCKVRFYSSLLSELQNIPTLGKIMYTRQFLDGFVSKHAWDWGQKYQGSNTSKLIHGVRALPHADSFFLNINYTVRLKIMRKNSPSVRINTERNVGCQLGVDSGQLVKIRYI